MATLASSRTGRDFQFYVQGCRQIVGCIPYRYKNAGGEIEVLLISSQKGPALFFPKGGWELDEHIKQAVSREAEEEAGVVGIIQSPLGVWRFKSKSQDKFHEGYMFSLLVTEELDVWPEKNFRQRIWMSVSEAREALSPPWMMEVLQVFVDRLGQEQQCENKPSSLHLELSRIENLRMATIAQNGSDQHHQHHLHYNEEEKSPTYCAYEGPSPRVELPRIEALHLHQNEEDKDSTNCAYKYLQKEERNPFSLRLELPRIECRRMATAAQNRGSQCAFTCIKMRKNRKEIIIIIIVIIIGLF